MYQQAFKKLLKLKLKKKKNKKATAHKPQGFVRDPGMNEQKWGWLKWRINIGHENRKIPRASLILFLTDQWYGIYIYYIFVY